MKKIRHMGMPFQAGIIDVGAHSIRLDIFEVSKKNGISLLESLSRTINLGYDVFRHGQVSPETLARLSSMLSDFALKLAEYRITFCRVVATSAIREAFNRDLVINRIRNDAGLELEVLETPEEIRITYLAMREALRRRFDFGMLSGIGLMIGAGSLQIFYFAHGLMRFCEEIPLGTTRLFDAFGRSAISIEQVIETLRSQDIGQRLAECVGRQAEEPVALIALGASVRVLAGVIRGAIEEFDENECVSIDPGAVAPATRRLIDTPPDRLVAEFKLPEEVASSVRACAGIISYFLEEFHFERFLCLGTTTRTALIGDLVRRSVEATAPDPFYDDLLGVCDAIGRKYGFDPVHASQVAALSLKFLEKLKRTFDFVPNAPLLLEAAARLHDIGRFVDTRQHHKHSYYLVSNMQLPGISTAEQRVVATVCRYHRKALPRESHPEYTALSAEDKVTTLKLAAILRVADALDCSRRKRFDKMKLVLRGHTMSVVVPESGDFRSERLSLEWKGGLFNQVFGLELKIEEAPLLT